jgi:hypothetical protein
MLDLVLKSGVIALGSIAPIMFGNERLFRLLVRKIGFACYLNGQTVPVLPIPPFITDLSECRWSFAW